MKLKKRHFNIIEEIWRESQAVFDKRSKRERSNSESSVYQYLWTLLRVIVFN